jgi:hypothetical protein
MSSYVVVSSSSNTVTVINQPITVAVNDSTLRGPPGSPGLGANDAYAQANAAYAQANAAYSAANTGGNADVYNQANAAYNQANTARNTANAAYEAANNASGNYGDANVSLYVLTHDVETKGNLEFIRDEGFGNTPYFGFVNPDSETLKLQTNISANNLNTDVLSVDRQSQNVTFTGNLLPNSNNTQSLGSPQNQWADLYVSNNTVYFNNTPLTIDANNNLLLNGSPITDSAYNQANLAYSQANTARTTANDAYGAANTANTNSVNSYNQANNALGTSNDAYAQANTARNTANDAYGAANTTNTNALNAYSQANTARDTANAAYTAANSAGGTTKVTANTGSQVTTSNINFINTSTVTVSVVSGDNGNANVSFTSSGGGATIAAPNNAVLVANALSGANGTNNFVFNVATNSLGVGTNTVNSNISVIGNVWVTTGINAATINITTANVQNVNGRSSLALGTSVGSNGNVIIHANGVEIIRATNARFVGINTTTPNSNLTVVGNVWVTTGFNVATINATTANVTTALVGTANVTTGNISGSLFVGSSITTGGSNGDISNVNTVYASVVSANDLFIKQVFETTNALANATGTLEHDCALGHIFVHSTPSANFTVNFANVTITTNNATAFTLVINQGGTAYVPTAVQVNSQAQTVSWQGGTQPAGNANKKDVVTFSVVNNNGTWITLGQLTTFG